MNTNSTEERKKIKRSKLTVFFATMSLLATIIAFVSKLSIESKGVIGGFSVNNQDPRLEQLEKSIDSLRLLTNKIGRDTINMYPLDTIALPFQLQLVNAKMAQQEETILALRQAINPLKPDEVLTIARIQDYVKILDKDVQHLREDMTTRQQSFEESVKREIASNSQSTYLILAAILPLIFNTIYTGWRDRKAAKEAKDL